VVLFAFFVIINIRRKIFRLTCETFRISGIPLSTTYTNLFINISPRINEDPDAIPLHTDHLPDIPHSCLPMDLDPNDAIGVGAHSSIDLLK
jgi:hypothetical protein